MLSFSHFVPLSICLSLSLSLYLSCSAHFCVCIPCALNCAQTALKNAQSPPAEVRCAILLEDVSRQLLELLCDPVESVREASLGFMQRFLERDGAAVGSQLFLQLLPVFSARVGRSPAAEEAEELRLLWAQLLVGFLALEGALRGALATGSAFGDVCEVLKVLCGDSFHSIKCEALGACVLLGRAVPERVHGALGGLAGACVGCLGHQRGPVRAAALLALQRLLPLGGESLPSVLCDTVLPALRLHVRYDRTPSVRKALAVALAHWLGGALPPFALRSQRAEATIFYLLAGLLADDTPEVAEAALEALEEAAARAGGAGGEGGGGGGGGEGSTGSGEEPQGGGAIPADLAAAAEAAAPDPRQAGYAQAAALAERTAASAMRDASPHALPPTPAPAPAPAPATASSAAALPPCRLPPALLPPPFKAHPSPPLRTLSARLLPAALTLALEEGRDWTVRCRLCGAGALRSLLVLGEAGAGVALEGCMEALCTGSRDEEAGVRRVLGDAGRILGACIEPSAQLAVLLPALRNAGDGGSVGSNSSGGGGCSGGSGGAAGGAAAPIPSSAAISSPQQLAATLAVLATVVSTMSRDALLPLLPPLADTLALPHLGALEPPSLRTQLALALAYAVQTLASPPRPPSSSAAAAAATAAAAAATPSAAAAPIPSPPAAPSVVPCNAALAIPPPALDALLVALLYLQDGTAEREAEASALATGGALAACLGFPSATELYGSAAHRLLTPGVLLKGAEGWERSSVRRRAFDTLLRVHRRALGGARPLGRGACEALVGGALQALAGSLAPSRDPELRLVQLVLLDALLQGEGGSSAGSSSAGSSSSSSSSGDDRSALVDSVLGEWSPRLMRECLLPNLTWRAGMVSSTIRKVTMAAVLSLGSRLLPPWAARALFPELLPVLKSCLGDDDATTRHLSCRAASALLGGMGAGGLSGEDLRAFYPEALKRLDDSNDAVRAVGCALIGALPRAAHASSSGGGGDAGGVAAEYSLDTLLVHLDDGDAGIQAAVYGAVVAWGALAPAYALKKAEEVRGRMRHTVYVDKLCEFVRGLAAGGGGGAAAGGGGGEVAPPPAPPVGTSWGGGGGLAASAPMDLL
jgi:hypothetical protein